MIRVLIVDDQEMIRLGLRGILQPDPTIEVVGDLSDGLGVLMFLEQTTVDVVLMDIRMPGIDGIEATRRIREVFTAAQVKIVILTTFDQDTNVLTALQAGANGFLSKGVDPRQLVAGITEVAEGGGALSSAAAAVLIGHVGGERIRVVDAAMSDRFATLTARERDVVIAACTGKTNAQIAADLYLSPFTVKTHANRAMAKVGAVDRSQMVAFAFQAGLAS